MDKILPKRLSMREAIEFFKSKVPMSKEQYYQLSEDARVRAFTVAGVAKMELLETIKDEINRAIERGETFEDFRKSLNEKVKAKGWKGPTAYQLDNIFRTNVQTAYSVGRYKQMTDPDVIQSRPYWMYDAVDDRATRPTHRAMDGLVYPATHPFWNTWYPPNGFRCRCSVQSLSERELRIRGLKIENEDITGQLVEPKDTSGTTLPARLLMPDPGFASNPAKKVWEPDLSKYPSELVNRYENRRLRDLQN